MHDAAADTPDAPAPRLAVIPLRYARHLGRAPTVYGGWVLASGEAREIVESIVGPDLCLAALPWPPRLGRYATASEIDAIHAALARHGTVDSLRCADLISEVAPVGCAHEPATIGVRRNGPRSAADVERDIRAAPEKNRPGPAAEAQVIAHEDDADRHSTSSAPGD